MTFFSENWFYMLLLAAFVAMHLFGSGCGHSHSRSKRHSERESSIPLADGGISSVGLCSTSSAADTATPEAGAKTISRRGK